MINNKNFQHRPISELMAIVRQDLRKLDDEGLIDEGTVIKTIMYCNDRLGIPIREVKQKVVPVFEGKAHLPKDFEKLYYVCKIADNTNIKMEYKNPFDNSFDRDIVYEAEVDRGSFGGAENYQVVIKKITNVEVKQYSNFIELELNPNSGVPCLGNSPNLRRTGKQQVTITKDGIIECPFEEGELYLMYVGNMMDEEGNLLFPFHPMITPYYEWAIKEKILLDAVFNSDGNYAELLRLAQSERAKAWLDAFNITIDKGYGEYVDLARKRELKWYNQYFKFWK